jgi:hypothetical protein
MIEYGGRAKEPGKVPHIAISTYPTTQALCGRVLVGPVAPAPEDLGLCRQCARVAHTSVAYGQDAAVQATLSVFGPADSPLSWVDGTTLKISFDGGPTVRARFHRELDSEGHTIGLVGYQEFLRAMYGLAAARNQFEIGDLILKSPKSPALVGGKT